MNTDLEKIATAKMMLAEARSLEDILKVNNLAEAAVAYAKAANLGIDAQNLAAEIAIRAKCKGGEVLSQLAKSPGKRNDVTFTNVGKGSEYARALEESGTSCQDGTRWQTMASIPPDTLDKFIQNTVKAKEELTSAAVYRMSRQMHQESNRAEKRTLPFPTGTYAVVYADPPWQYRNSGFDESAEQQYQTLSILEICALPVKQISTDRTVLFLWATNPLLLEALEVMQAWGFEYVTNMAWIKDRGRGKGWFLRSKHELLLISRRSETPHPKDRPDSCFEADRGTVHSRKPELAYQIIEQMYDGPYVELFARLTRAGWAAWGNEVENGFTTIVDA